MRGFGQGINRVLNGFPYAGAPRLNHPTGNHWSIAGGIHPKAIRPVRFHVRGMPEANDNLRIDS